MSGPSYTDRKGRTWYVKHSLTKTGKDRWTASKDPESREAAVAMPEGYEFHENVNAQVFVRKIRTSKIRPDETALVEKAASELKTACRVETREKEIVVYTSDFDTGPKDTISKFLLSFGDPVIESRLKEVAHFSPMLRFRLAAESTRVFSAERMSFKGPEPEWWFLEMGAPLSHVVNAFVPLLDDLDAFFELV